MVVSETAVVAVAEAEEVRLISYIFRGMEDKKLKNRVFRTFKSFLISGIKTALQISLAVIFHIST
jgi:hypothetical protein